MESSSIIGLHLITGMIVVGEAIGITTKGPGVRCDGIVVRFPMQIQANMTTTRNDNKVNMTMSPAVMFTKTTDILYNNDHIMWEFEPTDDITSTYRRTIEKAKTGLLLPEEKKLLLS